MKKNKGEYLDLRPTPLKKILNFDLNKISELSRITRGLIFAMLEASHSGHPGGSSSKVEELWSMLFYGEFAFDFIEPKHRCRDRVIWSAGHCTPLLYAVLTIIYEALKRSGQKFNPKSIHAVLPDDLLRFRHIDGPQGHVESYHPLADLSTGSSGHGLSGATGLAMVYRSLGLNNIYTYVLMGDAETEEGMSYEGRNLAVSLGLKNLIVILDRNHFGIDGDTDEVISSPYLNHWLGLGWNVMEVDGHNPLKIAHAFQKARQGFANDSPTVILCHTIKGKDYGKLTNTCDSHGTPAPHDDYVTLMRQLSFNIKGVPGKVQDDLEVVLQALTPELIKYILARLKILKNNLASEKQLVKTITKTLASRPLKNVTEIKRPKNLPPELVFSTTKSVATRKATQVFFKWLMTKSAFFYIGAGDLSKSILTSDAEQVYGIITPKNPLGRGIRFGIAEQNMAMFSTSLTQDILPGGFQPVSVFSSYGVFTSLMANAVRMALIGNHVNPEAKGFFILLAAHDGLETGEDGPTHQGLFWMSLYNAYPGIKVYKPLDANETIEMLFYALQRAEPIALSVTRPDVPVFDRKKNHLPPAQEAINGAYVFKPFTQNNKTKIILAVCGGQLMANVLEIMPELEKNYNVKIIAVTSPELFEELRQKNPKKAQMILTDEECKNLIALHNGWQGFLYPFILPANYRKRSFGVENYLKSGSPKEIYALAKLAPKDLYKKITAQFFRQH